MWILSSENGAEIFSNYTIPGIPTTMKTMGVNTTTIVEP